MLTPLILSGGNGTRLWPLSRKNLPKQFLSLRGQDTLFQQTVARTTALSEVTAPIVIANHEHRFLVAEQLMEANMHRSKIILEPLVRNTAPAITLGALEATKHDPDALLLVLPADHIIQHPEHFISAVRQTIPLAQGGWLLSFGIHPTHAETGFGYIKRGMSVGQGAYRIEHFVEKPDLETARDYLASGNYNWNSGMFLFRARCYLEELAQHAPSMLQAVRAAYANAQVDQDFIRVPEEAFSRVEANSIDYTVMEKTSRAAMIPICCGWSDIGSWSALWQVGEHDHQANLCQGDTLAVDTAEKSTLVAPKPPYSQRGYQRSGRRNHARCHTHCTTQQNSGRETYRRATSSEATG